MSSQKPTIPKGTRDFGPLEMSRRNYIFQTIKEVFRIHGYTQIETPAMENLDTLLGKYGEEGDKLLFKILNSGDFLSGILPNQIQQESTNALALRLCEKGLRYDLTVPFARFVVQHQHEITFPFKRFQIQPVWRADRPQKGRYREFYQCDADVIGSDSLLNEVDLLKIIVEVFIKLGIRITIKLNNRKILAGIAEYIGYADRITDITVAIDKFEKIGLENVNLELSQKGIGAHAIHELENILFIQEKQSISKLELLKKILKDSETGLKGIGELQFLFDLCTRLNIDILVAFDLTLARGLNYYTGAIIEVKASDAEIGSICGGGRYDDLTGIFGLKDISGVGVSFGADRIYDVMDQLKLFPAETEASTKVLIVNFGDQDVMYCLELLNNLQNAGIPSEFYPDPFKLKKQFAYADAQKIRYVVVAGENEIREGLLTVKNMLTGEQVKITAEELVMMVKG
jgi:histidyl-tRNA synthetase